MRYSVIIPCYNATATLAACLQSLRDQDFAREAFEIVVVDDCSTDDSRAIAAEFGCRIVECATNKGPGVARNLGAAAAQSEILAYTDSDCIVPSGWLRNLDRHFADEAVQTVFGGYCGTARDTPMEIFAFLECLYRQTQMDFHIELSSTSNFACRKSAFAAVGGFPLYSLWGADPEAEPFWGNEDMDIGYLLYQRFGEGVCWDGDNGVVHRFRSTLWTYAKQQAFFASASMVSFCKYPGLRSASNDEGRVSALAQLTSIVPLAGLLGAWLWWPTLFLAPLLSVAGVVLANAGFMRLMCERESRWHYRLRFPLYLIGRNIAWTLGAVRGVWWGIGSFFGSERRAAVQTAN
jgi:glycosyltransferase involved in cell wall biosynthesis